ncbi:MAG: AAA family ATPase, partial [Bacillaceae bacterium]|nr:AAA family ATPase [Bacillaceae bacterium]
LNELIGLKNVKTKVNDLIAYQKVQQMRKTKGLPSTKNTLHLAFMGKPGTGKTTVARIVGRIYKQIGLLTKGHFIEVSRTDLIAGYQGQTALKVKKVIEKAKGGVLFIDEAYSITENDQSDSYGRECLTELTKALEDYREDLVVIVAGYTNPMNKFFDSNPGLKSRFNTFIEFEDYTDIELEDILLMMCNRNEYVLSEEAKTKIKTAFKELVETKDESFANGRLVRNIYDELVMNHAKRVVNMEDPSREELSIIEAIDFKGL